MISFNNKKIEELNYNELSQQLFNISRYYSEFHINPDYTTMFLCVGNYLESGFSGYNFSIKNFIKYNKDKQISMYEKYILIYSYKKFLNGIIDLNPKKITINKLNLISWSQSKGELLIEVDCSKGTYIRSLARDIGKKIGLKYSN